PFHFSKTCAVTRALLKVEIMKFKPRYLAAASCILVIVVIASTAGCTSSSTSSNQQASTQHLIAKRTQIHRICGLKSVPAH
ncbi:MAG TPA: hypothetical protein VF393_02055, partial [archaeon]